MPKRYMCDFSEITHFDNLKFAFVRATVNKHNRDAYREYMKNLDDRLLTIQEDLINRTYKVSPYREKTIYEPKKRNIYILPLYDHIIQHAMMNLLQPILDKRMIENSYACRPGKGIHKGAEKTASFVRSFDYCLKGDMSKFYPSIVHDIMYSVMERVVKGDGILWLLYQIIYSFPGRINVPIGNYTSQWFGNMYLDEMDKYVLHVLHPGGYIRYCDDFLLFDNSKDKLKEYRDRLEDWCYRFRELRFSKSDIFKAKKQGVDFLGYRFFADHVLLRKSTSKRLIHRIHDIWKMIADDYKFTEYEALLAMSQVGSAIGWMKYADCYNLEKYLNTKKLHDIVHQIYKHFGNCQKFGITLRLKETLALIKEFNFDPTMKIIVEWR